MPQRIVLPAVTPAGGIRTYGSRFLSTTGTRQIASRRKLDEETGEEVAIDLNKEARQNFAAWVNGPGNNFRRPLYNQTNYLSSYDRKGLLAWQRLQGARLQGSLNMPFPLNPHFRSHPVLSEDLKEHIHNLVMVRGRTVRSVSAELGVSLERVSAVVRLKEVEKKWVAEGKPVATFLTKALHGMLPVTQLAPPQTQQSFHEGLQDMPSHPFSRRQAFVPVPESRAFTRADAGREFGLPPTEQAVPHPDLVKLQRERVDGLTGDERVAVQLQRDAAAAQLAERDRQRTEKRNQATVVEHGRWAWRLKPATTGSVGFRYGVPHQDRKKGQIKIPTHVA